MTEVVLTNDAAGFVFSEQGDQFEIGGDNPRLTLTPTTGKPIEIGGEIVLAQIAPGHFEAREASPIVINQR